jgi:hypothetical protein
MAEKLGEHSSKSSLAVRPSPLGLLTASSFLLLPHISFGFVYVQQEAPTMSNFSYVFVPSDSTRSIAAHVADKSGGLDQDALRLSAESHFAGIVPENFQQVQEEALHAMLKEKGVNNHQMVKATAAGMVGAVEIVTLLLPCPDNNFTSVSMYCDQNGKNKGLPLNQRASSIAKVCGHSGEIYGDVFFGRCMDDESKPWERLDFTIADLSSDAPWVKEAQQRNKGKSLGGYSTSGVLQNMLNSNKTSVIDGNAPVVHPGTSGDVSETEFITWTQTKEEMEVRVKLPISNVKSSDIDVKIHSKSLQVMLKSGQTISPEEGSSTVHKIVQKGGGELWAAIDPDCSAWTLDKTKHGDVFVVCTLAKNVETQWPQLTK